MERDYEDDLNFDAWFGRNKQYFPPEIKPSLDENFDLLHFIFHVYVKVMRDLKPALKKLMLEQYPVFKKEERPLVVENINNIASTTGYSLLFKLYNLVQGQKQGVNVREKYPKFDDWVDFYGRPQKPDTVDDTHRHYRPWLSDEEWEAYKEEENRGLLEFFNWKEKRKFEFIDVVQTILFKYYTELEELNADEWIIYAVDIVDEYDYYLTNCEQVELFIDCGFPEEDIKLSYADFLDNYCKLSKDVHDKSTQLRNRRIAGEKI